MRKLPGQIYIPFACEWVRERERERESVCVFQLNIYVCCYAGCIFMKIKLLYLIKCLNTRPLLLIHSWIRCWKQLTINRRTFLEIFRQTIITRSIIFSLIGSSAYTIFFDKPYKKKYGLVKSGDLRYHTIRRNDIFIYLEMLDSNDV